MRQQRTAKINVSASKSKKLRIRPLRLIGSCCLLATASIFAFYSFAFNVGDIDADEAYTSIIMEKKSIETDQHDENEACQFEAVVGSNVFETWNEIDQLVSHFPSAKVSGGIYLYARQAALLTSLIKMHTSRMKQTDVFYLCETGYGSGHSAALFLAASENVKVITFDKFDRPYQLSTIDILKKKFPGNGNLPSRIEHYAGDSCKEYGKYVENGGICDFLHGSSLCRQDNLKLIEYARPGVVLTSTAMKSLTDFAVYFGKKAQWRNLRERGCIHNIQCFREIESEPTRDLVIAKQGETLSHKFCFSVNTGTCSKLSNENTIDRREILLSSRNLDFESMCPEAVTEVPS